MDKLEKIEKTCIETKHSFYCDKCEKFLGDAVECEDGYYPKFGRLELFFNLPDGRYEVKCHFCDKCKEEFIELLRTNLLNMGFKKTIF